MAEPKAGTRTAKERRSQLNVEDTKRAASIAETFRALGLGSEDARERIRKLASPDGLEIGRRADNVDVETRNNTLVEAAVEHA